MSDIKLFAIDDNDIARELYIKSMDLERTLQNIIEKNMESFFGVTFLESEYSTGKVHGGRIDSLGIDENNCPVIFEYKRSINENVINQGLFYLDWLFDHKAEFELIVMKKLGKDISEKIEWLAPRLVCVAGDFTKYDEHAVKQINRNIELIRYVQFKDNLILFELVNATSENISYSDSNSNRIGIKQEHKTVAEYVAQLDSSTSDLYQSVKLFLLSLGDDVQEKTLKYYQAFKRIKNFVCLEVRPQIRTILLYVKLNPENISLEDGFTRDVRKIGHFGTGDLEITIKNLEQFEKAKPIIIKSYENG